jgi:hypothetical protein
MNIRYFSFSSLFLITLLFSVKFRQSGVYETFNSERFHALNSNGPSAGMAGAPGENNCTNCHAGQVQAGEDFNQLTWVGNEYTPGQTYTIELSMQDASSRNGFQLVPLIASDNTAAGTVVVTDDTKTQIRSGAAGKQYLTQRTAGNSSSTWSFDWTAPSSNVGNVIFYVATNKTNNNSQASGDLVRLSQHVFNAPQSSASLTEYQVIQNSLSMNFNVSSSFLDIKFVTEQKEDLYINMVNLQGQSMLAKALGTSFPGDNLKSVKIPNTLATGLYVVNFLIGNKAYSRRIMVD